MYYKGTHRIFSCCRKEKRLEVNADKSQCMVMSQDQNVG